MPDATDEQPSVILTPDRPIPADQAEAIRAGLAAALADTDPPAPPAVLQHQLVQALVRNGQLAAELADANRALAVLGREWANLRRPAADPDGQLVDRAERYGNDLDAQAAIERLRKHIEHLAKTTNERHLSFSEIWRVMFTNHNATAGSPT